VHGDSDTAFPVSDAAFAAAGSKDKTLRVFSAGEGGSQHVNADDPDPAQQVELARRLGARRLLSEVGEQGAQPGPERLVQ